MDEAALVDDNANGEATTATTTTTTTFAAPSSEASLLNDSEEPTALTTTRKTQKRLYRDSVAFEIPMDVTADVGIGWKRTRDRRIAALQEAMMKTSQGEGETLTAATTDSAGEKKMAGESTIDDTDDDDENPVSESSSPDGKPTKKRRKRKSQQPPPNSIMPHRNDFGNMIDYLEAKYVQGVMLDDHDDDDDDTGNNAASDRDDEGGGSVYSETSFLDDADLRRTVAEQVLAQTTTTRLELMQQDDDEFFVNVGDLQVEETEWTNERYDPLHDTDKPKKKRKRQAKVTTSANVGGDAKSVASNKSAATATTTNGKKKQATSSSSASGNKAASLPKSPSTFVASSKAMKKKPKLAKDAENQKPNATSTKNPIAVVPSDPAAAVALLPAELARLKEQCAERKAKAMHWYNQLVTMIQQAAPDELPRRKTTERVAVTCPSDKHPGDAILFQNPHVPGQKLKVKVPKNTLPGGTFKVTVPVQELDLDSAVDYNKLSRPFYDALDDYSRAYNEWCDSEAIIQKALDNADYAAHLEKRKKFDDLMKVFPANLKTPVDLEYMRKLLRRARQNRSKREQTLARKGGSPKEALTRPTAATINATSIGKPKEAKAAPAPAPVAEPTLPVSKTPKLAVTVPSPAGPTILLPVQSTVFATKRFAMNDFGREGGAK